MWGRYLFTNLISSYDKEWMRDKWMRERLWMLFIYFTAAFDTIPIAF